MCFGKDEDEHCRCVKKHSQRKAKHVIYSHGLSKCQNYETDKASI